jgi:hypothetical protein
MTSLAQDYFRCDKTLCKGPFVSKRPTTCVAFWWICSSYAHQQGKWRSDDANMDVNMTSQLDNTWTNPPTMCQLPKSSPLLSLLHQSHEWVCFGYMCGEWLSCTSLNIHELGLMAFWKHQSWMNLDPKWWSFWSAHVLIPSPLHQHNIR